MTANFSGLRTIRRTLPLLHAGFVVTGVFTVLLGPVLPLLSLHWLLRDSQSANFFMAQFGGLLLGVAASGLLLRREYRSSLVSGFMLMGLGAASLGRGPWQMALLSLFCMGLGNGFVTAATNLLVGESIPERRARELSFVNFSWTFGAVACPFLFKFFASPHAFFGVLWTLCALSALLAGVFALSNVDATRHDAQRIATPMESSRLKIDSSAVIFALLFFLYVGAETAVGGWLAAYSRREVSGAGTYWILTPALFWLGMMTGRGVGTLALRQIRERPIVQAGCLVGLGGILLLTRVKTLPWIYCAAFITGLGFSIIFPIVFAWMATHYGADARRMTGRMLAIGEFGAAGIPWFVGMLSALTGSLRFGLSFLFVDIAGVFMLASVIRLSKGVKNPKAIGRAAPESSG